MTLPWNYSRELYEKYLSDIILNEKRLKKLEKVSLPELQEIKACMMEIKKRSIRRKCWKTLSFYVVTDFFDRKKAGKVERKRTKVRKNRHFRLDFPIGIPL